MGLDTYFYRASKQDACDHFSYSYDEVAYFRKFWGLLKRLDYSNEHCGMYIEVPRTKLVELATEARKTIMMVEKYLTDQGWQIKFSPLNKYSVYDLYKDIFNEDDDIEPLKNEFIWPEEVIILENGIFTDSIADECDHICEQVYKESDYAIFTKVVILYQKLTDILNDTDFNTQVILHESDW